MASRQSDERPSTNKQSSLREINDPSTSEEVIELTELDYEELPSTDPSAADAYAPGSYPKPVPIHPGEYIDLRDIRRRHLSAPPCVNFNDDRVEDTTPPPVTEGVSLAPMSASDRPPAFNAADRSAWFGRGWKVALIAASVTAALGIVGLRAAQSHGLHKSVAHAPVVATTATDLHAAAPPHYTPEDFPIAEQPAAGVVLYEWVDLTNAPREDLPSGLRPAAEVAKLEPEPEPDLASGESDGSDHSTDGLEEGEARRTFDRAEAQNALSAMSAAAAACRKNGAPAGSASLAVTFAPSGRVTTATLEGGPFIGTTTGGCIARAFRGARVTPFEGGLTTVHKSVMVR